MRFFRFVKNCFCRFLFITLCLSSGTCFGDSDVGSIPEENKCTVCGYIGNFVLSTLVWRINVPITWTNYYDNSEGFRGTILGKGWYPKNLRFKNGNFKIGFALFEFRPVELVITGFLFWKYGLERLEECFYVSFLPIRFYCFHIKLWCIRMGWFNPGNIYIFFTSIMALLQKNPLKDTVPQFFITETYHNAKHSGYIFLLSTLIPYISIDMSYFYKNNKNEEIQDED